MEEGNRLPNLDVFVSRDGLSKHWDKPSWHYFTLPEQSDIQIKSQCMKAKKTSEYYFHNNFGGK